MRSIAIITVFLDILCWFFGGLSLLKNYTKSDVISPIHPVHKPPLGILIFTLVLLIMNILTLIHLFKNKGAEKDSASSRMIFMGIAWLAVIYSASCFIVGA